MSREEMVRARKVAALRERDYARVYTDLTGRIAVEVHEEGFSPEQHELFRRVWGPEWPVVRSERWKPPVKQGKTVVHTPDEQQFAFSSREY
ncbi:MAG: hypothetical protein M1541_10565 [Acidobacteria bacterium]|nr:hypothetical protein [Acidobacteriota bacterium]